jgi:response regulator RpfG family c-di-GMP phosphodiesterase
MPHWDGIEVVERLRAIDPKMRTIVETCYPELDSTCEAIRRGVNDYLVIPFRRAELLDCVERQCRELGLLCTTPAEANQLIGKRIRTERLHQALTLRQVSQRADLTTSQLSQVELGKNAISLWGLARIANALGLRLPALLSGL